jgi:Tol biopolymer transport system component/DNA-binding winged helix-turn-helix (wHTH) protein
MTTLRYRFGTFELDSHSAELRRNGVRLRLQEQPFLVLRRLLESPGTLVTREELHGALWPADTFVDFDTSLNTAVKRLREALGDSADLPVFIETVPRRGYRFLAPVQTLGNSHATVASVSAASIHAAPAQGLVAAEPRSPRHRAWFVLAGLLLAAFAAAFIVMARSPGPAPRVTDSTQITFDGIPKGNLRSGGAFLFFNQHFSDHVTLVRSPIAGGQPTVLDSSPTNPLYLVDASADGTKLLVARGHDRFKGPYFLKVMDLPSGSLQELSGTEITDASWAPGGRIVYAKDNDVFLADSDGTHPRKLLTAAGTVGFLRFSPDETRVRFTVSTKLTSEFSIWEARADGSNLHELFKDLKEFPGKCCGDWTPDGRYFLFETVRDQMSKIWAVRERSSFWNRSPSSPVQLTTIPPNFYMGQPTTDGKKLLVTASQPRAELVRYDSRTSQFVPFLSGISAGDVEGSRDGKFLVYARYPEDTLWRSKADGGEATQLTGPSLRALLPHWSPDGSKIAFAGSRPGKPWNIFLINAAGGPAEQISSGPVSDLDPSWSPDGSKLVYAQARMEGHKQVFSLQVMDMASRRVTQLPASDGICCPRWSPDGRLIMGSHGTMDDLVLYDLATQKSSLIVKDLGPLGYMEWASDSKSILFDTIEVAEPAFYRIHLSDLRMETVVDIRNLRRYYGDFGPWSGMAPDGSPLLVRDISNEEVYSLDLQLP